MNSELKESIMGHTIDSNYMHTNEMIRRYEFLPTDKRLDDDYKLDGNVEITDQIPYLLTTEKSISSFFKRQVSVHNTISILDADSMGINVADILSKMTDNRILITSDYLKSITNTSVKAYYDKAYAPIDEFLTIEEFWKLTGKFINVFKVDANGCMTKLDPRKTYKIDNTKGTVEGIRINILGVNSIGIHVYERTPPNRYHYVIEVLSYVKSYERSWTPVTNIDQVDNKIVYYNGVLYNPIEIPSIIASDVVEVYGMGINVIYKKVEGLDLVINNNSYLVDTGIVDGTDNRYPIVYGYRSGNRNVMVQYAGSATMHSIDTPNLVNVSKYPKDVESLFFIVLQNPAMQGSLYANGKRTHTSLFNILDDIYKKSPVQSIQKFHTYVVDELIKIVNKKLSGIQQTLLRYPFYYREELEYKAMKDLYIETKSEFPLSQVEDNMLIFKFPIYSYSYILFRNGKVLTDNYAENGMDASISVELGEDDLIDNDKIILKDPITIVRARSYYKEDIEYSASTNKTYLLKTDIDRYSFDSSTNDYVSDSDGDYALIDERYYKLETNSNGVILYEMEVNGDGYAEMDGGQYVKLSTPITTVPFNKFINSPYNINVTKNNEIYKDSIYNTHQARSNYPINKPNEVIKELNEQIDIYLNKNVNFEDSIHIHDADIGFSRCYSSQEGVNEYEIPMSMKYNYDQLMLFKDGLIEEDFIINAKDNEGYLKYPPTVSFIDDKDTHTPHDVFITDMPKLILYQTMDDMTLWSNMTIEVSDKFNDKVKEYIGRDRYRKNIDMVHVPLSLSYMLIFVNGMYMDKDHIEIISDSRFMLKNLQDYFDDTIPLEELDEYKDIPAFNNTDLYKREEIENDPHNNERAYKIHSIQIYLYPFRLDEKYLDYYKYPKHYYDETGFLKYREYTLKDDLYRYYMSDTVSYGAGICNDIVFVDKDNKPIPFKRYYMFNFRQMSLPNFQYNYVLRRFHYDLATHIDELFNEDGEPFYRVHVMADHIQGPLPDKRYDDETLEELGLTNNEIDNDLTDPQDADGRQYGRVTYRDLSRWIHGYAKEKDIIKKDNQMSHYSHSEHETRTHNELDSEWIHGDEDN